MAQAVKFWEGTGEAKGLTVTSLELQAVRLWAGVQALGARVVATDGDTLLHEIAAYMQTASKASDEELLEALFLAKARAKQAGEDTLNAEPGVMHETPTN